MKRMLSALFMALAIAPPASAQGFRAENGVRVTAIADGFSVADAGGYGARGMWCAAADYARDVLGSASNARLYIAEGRAPGLGQRAPVRFTLDPTGLDPVPVLIVGFSLRSAGSNLSVGHAYGFCEAARDSNR